MQGSGMSDSGNDVYRRKKDVLFRVVEDEGILLKNDDAEVFGLNTLGARVLEWVDQEMSVDEMVEEVLATYEVDRVRAFEDVRAFLKVLEEGGLLVRAGRC